MFDSLKNKFRNLFKKDPEGSEGGSAPEPKKNVPDTKPIKEKAPKKVFDDDWDDDWDGEPNDLIPDDGEDGDADEDAPEPAKREEPAVAKREGTAGTSWTHAAAPAAKPADDTEKLSRKERAKIAKLEKTAAKRAEKEKRLEEKERQHEEKAQEKRKEPEEDLIGDRGKKIKERNLDEVLWELEVALMEADVAMPVVREITDNVKDDLMGRRYARGHSLDEVVEISVRNSVSKILRINEFDFDAWFESKERPAVIMFVGINGTGKTTAIAKVANRLIKNERTVVLAASDTFRAGAIEQLTIHSERLGCKIVKHSANADPAAVAYDAIDHAKAKRKDAVLVDTAGRMQTNSNLMDEMKKIKKVARPDLVVFVGDSLAGNDAVEQARAFDAAVGVDAIMLTKIDADSKGGAALSIAHTIGKPIAFVSNGQEYDQLIKFNAKWMTDRLFED